MSVSGDWHSSASKTSPHIAGSFLPLHVRIMAIDGEDVDTADVAGVQGTRALQSKSAHDDTDTLSRTVITRSCAASSLRPRARIWIDSCCPRDLSSFGTHDVFRVTVCFRSNLAILLVVE